MYVARFVFQHLYAAVFRVDDVNATSIGAGPYFSFYQCKAKHEVTAERRVLRSIMCGQFTFSGVSFQSVVIVGYPEVAFVVNAEVGIVVGFGEGSRQYLFVVYVEQQDVFLAVGTYQGVRIPEFHSLDEKVLFVA